MLQQIKKHLKYSVLMTFFIKLWVKISKHIEHMHILLVNVSDLYFYGSIFGAVVHESWPIWLFLVFSGELVLEMGHLADLYQLHATITGTLKQSLMKASDVQIEVISL